MTTPTISFRPKAPAGTVPVSLDRLIESKLLVQANSGGGKSWAVRYLLEQTHGRLQHIVLDREGEFATLREQYPYLLVGRDGDVAADVRSAKLLARKLLELGLSAVIDLSEMSLGQQREYIRVFIDAMNNLPRSLWKDCLVVIDEAHLFAPEKGKGASVASEAIALALSTWRKRGFCMALATQRLAKLDKDVAAECLNKMIGRTSQEDLARAGDELGLGKVDAKSLRSLTPGTFWTYGPAIGPEPILVRTGAVATHPPKRGTAREPAPVAPATIKKVMAELADLPKQAADEQRTLEELQRELRETKAKLAQAEKGGVVREVEKPVADPRAIARAVAAATADATKSMHQLRSIVDRALDAMSASGHDIISVAEKFKRYVPSAVSGAETAGGSVGVTPATPPVAPVSRPAPARVVITGNGATDVAPSEQKILDALALMEQIGSPGKKVNLGFFAGYSEGGRFNNLLGGLRSRGLVHYPSPSIVALTDEGRTLARADAHPVRTLSDLHALWLAKLPPSEGKLLTTLLEVYPNSLKKSELGQMTGYSEGGRFNNLLGKLRSLGAIDYPTPGSVIITDALFPEGLD